MRQVQAVGDETSLAEALTLVGQTTAHDGRFPEAYNQLNQALAIQRRLGDQTGIALSLGALGAIAMVQGDYEKAEAYLEEGLALARQAGNLWRTGILLRALGQAARRRGSYGHAQALLREGLILSQRIKDPWNLASCLLALGGPAQDTGTPDRTAILFGAVEKMGETLGSHLDFAENLEYQRDLETLRIRMDGETLDAAWSGGRALHADHVIKYALSGLEQAISTPEAWSAHQGEAKNN